MGNAMVIDEATRTLLRQIGATGDNAWVKCGYVTRDGSYATVEGRLRRAITKNGEVTGLKVDYHGNGELRAVALKSKDGLLLLALDRIAEGERIRAEKLRTHRATVLQGPAAAPQPATSRQVAYAMDLWAKANAGLSTLPIGEYTQIHDRQMAEYRAMTKTGISTEIATLREETNW